MRGLSAHFRGQVVVSLILSVASGVIALVLGAGWLSLLIAVAAVGVYMLIASGVYYVAAPAQVHYEGEAYREALVAERDALQGQLDELHARRDLKLVVAPRAGEPMPRDPSVLKLTLYVRNEGQTSEFVAQAIAPVVGVAHPDYWSGKVAWEGAVTDAVRLPRGVPHFLHFAYLDAPRRRVQFVGPPSSYTSERSPQVGIEQVIAGSTMGVRIEIRDIEVDEALVYDVGIVYDDETNYPSVTVDRVSLSEANDDAP
jgi:hypothetical protein